MVSAREEDYVPSDTVRIFVYGTLRKGFANHHFLEDDCEYLGEAKSVNKYSMTAREYEGRFGTKRAIPFVSKEPEVEVLGEVYEVSQNVLKLLDRLENHPYWYVREEAEFEVLEGVEEEGKSRIVKAWIYFNEVDKGEISLSSGDFASHYPRRK